MRQVKKDFISSGVFDLSTDGSECLGLRVFLEVWMSVFHMWDEKWNEHFLHTRVMWQRQWYTSAKSTSFSFEEYWWTKLLSQLEIDKVVTRFLWMERGQERSIQPLGLVGKNHPLTIIYSLPLWGHPSSFCVYDDGHIKWKKPSSWSRAVLTPSPCY